MVEINFDSGALVVVKLYVLERHIRIYLYKSSSMATIIHINCFVIVGYTTIREYQSPIYQGNKISHQDYIRATIPVTKTRLGQQYQSPRLYQGNNTSHQDYIRETIPVTKTISGQQYQSPRLYQGNNTIAVTKTISGKQYHCSHQDYIMVTIPVTKTISGQQ